MKNLYYYITEMSLSKKQVERQMNNQLDQIFQNWFLIRFSNRYTDDEVLTINHWKNELNAAMSHLCDKKTSSGNLKDYIMISLDQFEPNMDDLMIKLKKEQHLTISKHHIDLIIKEFDDEKVIISDVMSRSKSDVNNYINAL